ncbi:MAG: hypothetical protein CMH62_00380 [Nanoarchaeota archaeon]|nr:hypothetical protein [Nanoarchaeota archaeon]|tara:strand:+ start:213 stop:881 length:669 start_codon:yes stop_codon:yes gene_type:complete
MLKTQLHIHAGEDKVDKLGYSAKDVIDKAKALNFDVIAFTFHDAFFYTEEIKNYAKENNILLIPGIEKTIENRHVLILGIETFPELNKLSDLKKLNNEALIIAPHPFYPRGYSLKEKLIENIDLFHCIEHSFLYTSFFNYNKKAIKLAKKHNKPIFGSSDIHDLYYFDKTYTLVDSKKTTKDVINAIKSNKIKLVTKPVSIGKFISTSINVIFHKLFKLFRN